MSNHEQIVPSLFGLPESQCLQCRTVTSYTSDPIINLDTEELSNRMQTITMKDIIFLLIKNNVGKLCCQQSFQFKVSENRCLILNFSNSLTINLEYKESVNKLEIAYQSHIQETNVEHVC